MSDLIYVTLRQLTRVVLDVYFARIDVEGEEEVPDGPIVIASNHPNAFIDVALVATRLERRVHFVAKAPLFKPPVAGWFLRTLGAVPVERRMEREGQALDPEAQARNARALVACEEVVAGGGALLIFPEGTSEQVPRLLPLKTGVARIALGAEERRGQNDIQIVPVAVRYDRPTDFRSHAYIRFLPPIPVTPFRAAHADAAGSVRALTAAVRDALEPSVVHVEREAWAGLVAEIDALYGRQLAASREAGDLSAAPAIARALNLFARTQPERVTRVRDQIYRYRSALDAAGLDDAAVRPGAPSPSPGQAAALLLGAPIALWGALHHFVPYQLTRLVTTKLVTDPTFVSTIKLVLGTLIYLAWYMVVGVLAGRAFGPWVALGWVCSLPLSGIVALEVREALQARARQRRRRRARARVPAETLRELERQRQAIISELDRARAEYLLDRAEPAPEGVL